MTSDRKPTVVFSITVALVAVLVAYPLSFGPACWVNSRNGFGNRLLVPILYQPILRLGSDNENLSAALIHWYAGVGAVDRMKPVIQPPDGVGSSGVVQQSLTPWPGFVKRPNHDFRIVWREP